MTHEPIDEVVVFRVPRSLRSEIQWACKLSGRSQSNFVRKVVSDRIAELREAQMIRREA